MSSVSERLPSNPVPARSHYSLGVLLLVFIFSHIDRNILNILVQPIKEELGASDTAMGALTGFAFALLYAALGIPIARLADRASRKAIILIGLVLWSIMTAAQGLARVFWQLVIARVLVGVGEATTSPASHSMISDYYPPDRRATPLAIFTAGGHIGMMFGYVLGGFINDWFGWRTAFVVVGLPGIALAFLMWATVREPARGASEGRVDENEYGLVEAFRYLWQRRAFRHLNLSSALYVTTIYGFNVWGPAFLMRVHDMSTSQAGLYFGPVTGIAGLLGTLFAGALADRLSPRDVRWQMWIPVIGGLGAIPFSVAFLLWPDPGVGLLFYGVQVFLATFWMAPSFWVCQGLAKVRMRSMAAAFLLLNINLIGSGLGPFAIGVLNDVLRERFGEEGIRYSLLLLGAVLLWATLHSLAVNRTLRSDLRASAD